MASTTNVMHSKQFSDQLLEAVQIKQSALEMSCSRKEIFKGESLFINKIGTVELDKIDTLNAKTEISDISNTRRKISFDTFKKTVAIDRYDQNRSEIYGLDTGYINSLKYAVERKKEEIIANAATSIAYEGKEGTTSVAFPDATNTLYQDATASTNGTSNESGTKTGLTADKLLRAMYVLRKNMKNGNINEKIYCALSEEEVLALMQDNKIINRDFTAGQVLDKGIIGSWLGINFIRTQLLKVPAVNVREILLYTESAVALGMPGEVITKFGENPERNFLSQMHIELNFGAARIEDEKIVKIRVKTE